jgi:hypothetical protein
MPKAISHPPGAGDEGSGVSIRAERTVNSPILRLAKSPPAVEDGLLVAGVTITGVAVLQSIIIVMVWMFSGVG